MTKFFLLDLILFLIIGGVAIILQYHFGNRINKKFEIVYGCISAGIIAVTTIVFTIKMNPIITPSLHADYLKLNEEIKYTSIELCENYRDCTLKIVANGFRWGYQTYYSGDANVEIYNSKNEKLDYYYKAKVYYNLDVNDFIVLKDVNENKIYIFNFDTNQQTQNFYDLALHQSYSFFHIQEYHKKFCCIHCLMCRYYLYSLFQVSIPLSEVHAICYRSPHNPLKKSIFFKS